MPLLNATPRLRLKHAFYLASIQEPWGQFKQLLHWGPWARDTEDAFWTGSQLCGQGKERGRNSKLERKRKGFRNRNLCLFTLRWNSRGVRIETLNLRILHRYCIWENGQADIRGTRVQKKTDLRISSHFGYHNLVARFVWKKCFQKRTSELILGEYLTWLKWEISVCNEQLGALLSKKESQFYKTSEHVNEAVGAHLSLCGAFHPCMNHSSPVESHPSQR